MQNAEYMSQRGCNAVDDVEKRASVYKYEVSTRLRTYDVI